MNALHEILPGGTLGQVCTEALAALSATEPRASRDIFDQCQTAEKTRDLSKALYELKQRGLIVDAGLADPLPGRGSRVTKLYLLSHQAADARLAEHLERELAERPPLGMKEEAIASDMLDPLSAIIDDDALDPIEPTPQPQQANTLHEIVERHTHRWSIAIQRELEDLSEPRMLHADEYAEFLRELRASPIFRSSEQIREYLGHIADELEAVA